MKGWVDLSGHLPKVATEVSAIPSFSWLSRSSAPQGTVGVKNLPTVVTQWPAPAGFEPVSFKHESNALSTLPSHHQRKRPILTYWVRVCSVGLSMPSVGNESVLRKNGWLSLDAIWVMGRVGGVSPRNHVFDVCAVHISAIWQIRLNDSACGYEWVCDQGWWHGLFPNYLGSLFFFVVPYGRLR